MNEAHWEALVEAACRHDHRAIARLISFVENRNLGWRDAMHRVFPMTGRAHVIGITGTPGAGKSTLTGRLSTEFADRGRQVAVIAVDPSSPFTGGAILADRVRMTDLNRPGVFMRSMASRGTLGGLSQATRDAVRILDASGFDLVLVETVGVGQDEIDIMRAAQVTVVVCAPGQGDALQAMKAGLMEIADVFVVNKADREGAVLLAAEITAMLRSGHHDPQAVPMTVSTTATTGAGVAELVRVVENLLSADRPRRNESRDAIEAEVRALTETAWHEMLWERLGFKHCLAERLGAAHSRTNPYVLAHELSAVETLRGALRIFGETGTSPRERD